MYLIFDTNQNTPLTYCVGIDKEKEIAESACTEVVFFVLFLQFFMSNVFRGDFRKPIDKTVFLWDL